MGTLLAEAVKFCSLDLFRKCVHSVPTKTTRQGLTTGNGTAVVHYVELQLSFYYYREVQLIVVLLIVECCLNIT
jgi:hypothetical protein